MRFKRITMDGMKWWVPCRTDDDSLACFTKKQAIELEKSESVKAHNPSILGHTAGTRVPNLPPADEIQRRARIRRSLARVMQGEQTFDVLQQPDTDSGL